LKRYLRFVDRQVLSSVLRAGIWLYQVSLSLAFRGACRFHPSCSRYAKEALREHGAFRGTRLAVARVLKCHPFNAGGFDPVPRAIGPREKVRRKTL
jgi:putative membrane protein insertion efficiency factor